MRCAGSTSPTDRSRRASKIPTLRSRSTSLSRPGSRCSSSRPRSRTENKSPGRSESVVFSSSRNTRRPNLNRSAAAGDRAIRGNWKSTATDGSGKTRRKSTVENNGREKIRGKSESALPADDGNGHRNSPERQILDPEAVPEDETVAAVTVTETSDPDRGVGTVDDVVGTGSMEDRVRPGSLRASDDLSVEDGEVTTSSRRERRSCSLDRSKPRNLTSAR